MNILSSSQDLCNTPAHQLVAIVAIVAIVASVANVASVASVPGARWSGQHITASLITALLNTLKHLSS